MRYDGDMRQFSCFILTFFLLLLSSCSSGGHRDQSVLHVRLGAEPSFLNPVLYSDSASSSVASMVFNGLMKVDEHLNVVPDLAESYTISEDGLRYTFKLRQNIRFHDGHLLNAEDVIYTFGIILSPKTNTVRRSGYMINGKPIEFVEIDPFTVQAILPEPFAPFLTSMGMGILPAHLLHDQDINTSEFNRNPIGTGPFKFVEWRAAQYVKLVRNDDYFDTPAKVSGILMKIIPDANTARLSIQNGDIDIQDGVQAKDVPLLETKPHLALYDYYSLAYTYIGFNLTKYPFNDRRFRLAVSHAINREAIVRAVLKGYGRPTILPSTKELWAYPSDPNAVHVFDYNPDKSKQLIESLGYQFNSKTGYYEKDGAPLQFTILTNKGNKYREKTAQIIQRFLQNVGIKVSIHLMEWSSFIKVTADPTAFDALISGWALGIDPDGYSIWHSSQHGAGFNFIGYNNPKVDALLEAGRRETVVAKRKTIYAKMYREITYDIPYYFLYQGKSISAVNKRVKGIIETPGPAGIIHDIRDVYLEP